MGRRRKNKKKKYKIPKFQKNNKYNVAKIKFIYFIKRLILLIKKLILFNLYKNLIKITKFKKIVFKWVKYLKK